MLLSTHTVITPGTSLISHHFLSGVNFRSSRPDYLSTNVRAETAVRGARRPRFTLSPSLR